jgi:hypothetical protein
MTGVATHLPHLSAPQARLLAWWSFGIAHTRSCGRVTVAVFLALLLAEGANRIELRRGDTVLDSLAAGSAVPQVTISSPTGGTFSSGSVPVAWSASDADGDPLDVVVEYSTDGGTSWVAVAFGQAGSTLDLPISELAGSDNARIRVTASDGFNQGSAVSPAFRVADTPPQPYISAPLAGESYTEGVPVPLRGGAFVPGAVSPSAFSLRWSSDRDGDLGTGAALDVVLSVGRQLPPAHNALVGQPHSWDA